MKKITPPLIAFLLLAIAMVSAQTPPMFNYQAVLRDAEGHPVVSQDVTIDIAILTADEKSSEVFSETHQVTTNAFGLVNLTIGSVNTLEGIDSEDEMVDFHRAELRHVILARPLA